MSVLIQNTSYMKALLRYSSAPFLLQNHGFVESNRRVGGQFLTVDMCPSIKPFELAFFQSLVAKSVQSHHPIPLAISVSGLWIMDYWAFSRI